MRAPSSQFARGGVEVAWDPDARLGIVRYAPDTTLDGRDGDALVDTLRAWTGRDALPWGFLIDAKELRGTDAEYRSKMSDFLRECHSSTYLALFNAGPVIRVLIEMFRIGSGVDARGFPDEERARAWLRSKGIRA